MPPCTKPQRPRLPPTPPMQWCIRMYAVPGVERGPPLAPDDAVSRERDFDLRRFRNHSSSRSAALCVKTFTRPVISRNPRTAELRQQLPGSRRNRPAFGGSSGGVTSNSDSTTRASRSMCASYLGTPRHRAPRTGRFSLPVVFCSSLQKKRWRPSGKDGEERGVLRGHAIAENWAPEFQFADDSFLQEADEVSACGDFVARPEFFGHGTSAEHLAAFQHQHLAASACEICRRDQTVVAATDDDGVVAGHLSRVRCGSPPPLAAARSP